MPNVIGRLILSFFVLTAAIERRDSGEFLFFHLSNEGRKTLRELLLIRRQHIKAGAKIWEWLWFCLRAEVSQKKQCAKGKHNPDCYDFAHKQVFHWSIASNIWSNPCDPF
jgi:hypothetical protein